jgi:hypothetical protein
MSVYFHANFGLNRNNMSKLLLISQQNINFRDVELAKPFEYKAPFSARTRSWLNKTGFIDLRFPVKLTDIGNQVFLKDPNFNSIETQQFMHTNLTSEPINAEAWHYFYNEFLDVNKEFDREQLISGLTMKLRHHSEDHFGPGSKLNIVIARKIIECYTADYALGDLGVIMEKDGYYIGKKLN